MNRVIMTVQSALLTAAKVTIATGSATTGVLTNPFRENRKSFKRRYNGMRNNLDFVKVHDTLEACDHCDSVYIQARKAGTSFYGSMSGRNITIEQDTHCPEHWDMVVAYQRRYRYS